MKRTNKKPIAPRLSQPIAQTAIKQVYPYLIKYFIKNGITPTLGEIGQKFDRTSEWARYCVKALVKAKYIKKTKYAQRGIRIIDPHG